jgi:hypothetical protein
MTWDFVMKLITILIARDSLNYIPSTISLMISMEINDDNLIQQF